jgi:hypothetical protein
MKKIPTSHTMTKMWTSLPALWIGLGLALVAVMGVLPAASLAGDAGSELSGVNPSPGRHLFLSPDSMPALTDEALLDSLQRTAFEYFWNEANPVNGLIRDRSQSWSPCSIAAQGFGITAICIAIDHGWVSLEDGRDRIMLGMETLWNGVQGPEQYNRNGYMGLFYHFLDINSGVRTWDSELSTIDTALLMAGVLDARQYFVGPDPADADLRALADSLYHRVDWEFMRNSGTGIRMGWKPETGFNTFGNWIGYNEAMILYILALGSPTHPVPDFTWGYWTSGYNWSTQYGYTYVIFPPLFGHQYSHCWIDFRDINDQYMSLRGITYFENSRRATLAAREYCIANPLGWTGYGADNWGLTASDDPDGYLAHGAPPAQNDNGTITPTAAAGSISFAPEVVIPALQNMYNTYGSMLWGKYGFKDAFNPTRFWWGTDYLGIDQGPIIIMIENYLNGSVWNRFMQNPDILRGLAEANFTSVSAVPDVIAGPAAPFTLEQNFPNPFFGSTSLSFRMKEAGHATLRMYDVRGRLVKTIFDQTKGEGEHQITLDSKGLASGVYFYSLESRGHKVWKRAILVK